MSTNIYTREECKKLIDELGIISQSENRIDLRKKYITTKLRESILFHTIKCRDNMSERVYWIVNDIEDYPSCKECGTYFKPRYYGLGTVYHTRKFCSPRCASINEETQNTTKQTCLVKYGVEYSWQSEYSKEKSKQAIFNKFGVTHQMHSPIVLEKIKRTCEERYDVDHPWKSEIVKEKLRNTWEKNLGFTNPFTSPVIREKVIKTNLEKIGVPNVSQCPIVKEKKKQTCLKNHGVEYSQQSPLVREKRKKTCKERYNVEHALQNKDIFKKALASLYSTKILTLPSGKEITYQGYENVAIFKLLEDGYLEEQIITEIDFIPQINYQFNDKDKTYYPDIFIPHENKIIEVKSTYTYSSNLEINLAKRQACLDQGYLFEFWICSNKELLEII